MRSPAGLTAETESCAPGVLRTTDAPSQGARQELVNPLRAVLSETRRNLRNEKVT